MKELSIEEKAQRYDKALEAIKSLQEVNPSDEGIQNWVNENFPELNESEDEKILRHLKAVVKEYDMWTERGLSMNDVLAWLEKKGEQKPAWSEEDNERIEQICEDLRCGLINFKAGRTIKGLHFDEIIESNINWLKSLKPQNRWKPSDEQIKAVKEAACYSSVFSEKTIDNLISLSKDLKKLKG